jgi:hypothetical protein
MARTLEQIVAELNPTFQPQVQSLQNRAAELPGQIKSEQAGLKAKQGEAFDSILGGARQRGLGFSGIPLGEQAKYSATEYLPALARLQQSGRDQAMSLQDAILGINERRDTQAQQIYQTEQNRAESARQASAAQAAQASFGNFGNFGGDSTQGADTKPKINRSANGGYNFTDAYGEPVNAAEYVALQRQNGVNLGYRELLTRMANDGDSNAKLALQYVGNDAQFGNAPTQYRGALSALGATGNYTTQGQQNLSSGIGLRNTTTGNNLRLPAIMNGRYQ